MDLELEFELGFDNTKVRFEENLGNEVSDDSENEARVDTAGKESMDTGSESEASDDSVGSMETESPARRTRARTSAAVGWRGSY